MTDEKPRVIIIPPKPELQQTAAVTKQLRVAAYCRVSTKEEEQASSYEAQCEYYTDKIMSNKEWTMAGIFADEGITGTSTKKRTEFLRMIRQCKQKKIDLILTKSIQRFARNTLDCINYTRILRQLGIGVLFEKENINSLPADSEFMITMYGAMAQSESESISGNIRRGRQMHAKVGTLKIPCHWLYGYKKDAGGKFCIIPEQAEVVREIYERYKNGASLRNLKDWLEENQIKTVLGTADWSISVIKGILTNEKYCGDVLLQKTFCTDVISKKIVKNVGQMAQYYMPDHHEAIVSREQYNAVKAEMARRSALRSPSKEAVTGRSCYTSKYALSDRLFCGECGTLYRRKTRNVKGNIYHEWRCISRLEYGKKYCHESPTLREIPLQNAILAAINSAMSVKTALVDQIKNVVSLELLPVQGQTMSLVDIERRLAQLDEQFQRLLAEAIDAENKEACNAQFAEIFAEQTSLKKQKETILQSSMDTDRVCTRMKQAEQAIESTASTITEWNENAVRQIVERVTVLSTDEILVRIKGGAEIKQRLER
jgi:resolvase, n-terminal:recombinase, putative